MIRKDFELIARALYVVKPEINSQSTERDFGMRDQWWRTVQELKVALDSTNSQFDPDKFEHYASEGKY